MMERYVDVFKAIAEPTRLRILRTLVTARRELCICDIMDVLGLAQYNISKHVRELRLAGIVSERREGRYVHYSLSEGVDLFMKRVLAAVEAIPGETFARDEARLEQRLDMIRRKADRPCEGEKAGCCGKKRRMK